MIRRVKGHHTPVRRQPKPNPQQTASSLSLPTEKKLPETDLSKYTTLIYGREKIGKTTLASTFPDALFFTTEPGTKGLSIFEFNSELGGITDWHVLQQAVQLLKKNKQQFKTIVIDTVDRAYDMCLDWVCADLRIDHPGEDESGKNDWGKSWKAVKKEFLRQIDIIQRIGLGIVFVSHAKEEEIRTRSGYSYTRIFPSMQGQARQIVQALVDMFFYAEYFRERRVLICQGDETIWAGARRTPTGKQLPRFLPLDSYETIRKAFFGEASGISERDLIPGAATSKAATKLIRSVKGSSAHPS